jgi:hypothetical protein
VRWWTSAMASCARRPGRKPYEHGAKSASKMGSNTSLSAACATRSRTVGMPSRRRLPPALGIIRSRTGSGRSTRARRSARSSARNVSSPRPVMSWAVWPSTPAERAPRLVRTRCHATSRVAGSQTRLKRPPNRRVGSSVAHRCSLVCIRSTRVSASDGVGHGAPVFTGDLLPCTDHACEVAAPLRPVAGFPGLRLLRGLCLVPASSADRVPARCPGAGRAAPGRFPRSPQDRSTGVVPS